MENIFINSKYNINITVINTKKDHSKNNSISQSLFNKLKNTIKGIKPQIITKSFSIPKKTPLKVYNDSRNSNIAYYSKTLTQPKYFQTKIGEHKVYGAYNSYINNRPYNEDRILIKCPLTENSEMNLFAIFDGHSGKKCSNFLLEYYDNILYNNLKINDKYNKAINESYLLSDKIFKEINKPKNLLINLEKSGSCALSILTVNNKIYSANAGDSRAIYSENFSKEVYQISYEHKPKNEMERILKAGGTVYANKNNKVWRISPGNLAVSRSIGDISLKNETSKLLISKPEILSFNINKYTDFIIMGCNYIIYNYLIYIADGIFDRLTNKDVVSIVWETINTYSFDKIINDKKNISIEICNEIILKAKKKGSSDNLSCVFIGFDNLFSNKRNQEKVIRNINFQDCNELII